MFLLLQLYLKKFASLGSQNTVRGIPVREWGACFYDDAGKATVKLTMSFSSTIQTRYATSDILFTLSPSILTPSENAFLSIIFKLFIEGAKIQGFRVIVIF
jgi:hypothetical protein